jgi:hypothetical protein
MYVKEDDNMFSVIKVPSPCVVLTKVSGRPRESDKEGSTHTSE